MLKSGEILVESTDESAYFRVLLFVRQEAHGVGTFYPGADREHR